MAEKITLTKQDRKKFGGVINSFRVLGTMNVCKMVDGAIQLFLQSKKLYSNKEDQVAALKRHMEFYNTHPYVSSPVMGVTLALEEEKSKW